MQLHSISHSHSWCSYLFIIVISVILFTPNVHGIAVMSVDLGTEWMKVAIVSVSIHPIYVIHTG